MIRLPYYKKGSDDNEIHKLNEVNLGNWIHTSHSFGFLIMNGLSSCRNAWLVKDIYSANFFVEPQGY